MAKARKKREPRWVKALTEYLPLVVFLLAYKVGDLSLAIKAIVITTVLAVAVSYLAVRRLPLLTLLAAALVLLFGGVAILLGDDSFYKMKPTVLYALFAIALLVARTFGRYLLKFAFEDVWKLTELGWQKLTTQYAIFLLIMAALNEVIWRSCSEDVWVAFKVFGGVGLVLAFTASRIPFAKRHSLPKKKKEKKAAADAE